MTTSLSLLFILLSTISSVQADANPIKASPDQDQDVLPDLFEDLLGTCSTRADTDFDGVIDGVEYVLHSDPLDQADVPVLEPGMRIAAYQQGDCVKLCLIFFPGDMKLLESFVFYLGYGASGGTAPNGQGQLDFTSLIPLVISEVAIAQHNQFIVSNFVLDLPAGFIRDLAPLSVGVGAKMAGESFVDIADFDLIDNQIVQRIPVSGNDLSETSPSSCYFAVISDDPPPAWNNHEVCKTDMEVISTSDGVTKYEITKAECSLLIRKVCSPSECASLVGSQVISIDPGFIKEKL